MPLHRRWPQLMTLGTLILCAAVRSAAAQDSYEIQVYPSETVQHGVTMFELHSNYTSQGLLDRGPQLSSNHALHETIEVTHGFTDWFEVGVYLFTATQPGGSPQWVGDHVRPRVRVPETWHWPVGASLSMEVGYQRPQYAQDTWSWEIRPIIDQHIGALYWSLNPVFGVALSGPGKGQGAVFSPNVKASVDVVPRVALGLEYYGSVGPLGAIQPRDQQEHQLFPTVDLDLGANWEFNLGVGVGLTPSTDHMVTKLILGRRL